MITIDIKQLDIHKIASSGQSFRIYSLQDITNQDVNVLSYRVISENRLLLVTQGNGKTVLHCDKHEFRDYWRHYFDLERDYDGIRKQISQKDGYLLEAACASEGLRLLCQDPWEMLLSFIISQRKNIPAITKCIQKLCEQFGETLQDIDLSTITELCSAKQKEFKGFPSAEALAGLNEVKLGSCSLGYRAPYIMDAAQKFASGELVISELEKLDDGELFNKLLTIKGVGKKVALCTMLYGFNRLDSFPIDVWMQRVLTEHYPEGFPHERYHGHSGILQLWLFYAVRNM